MSSYCELKALPDPEIIQSTVIAELMQVLHKLLPAHSGKIGLAFPGYGQQRTLGGIIRILGAEQSINTLHQSLAQEPSIKDYALLTSIEQVPKTIKKHLCYERRQCKGNSVYNRLKKRHQQRGTWNDELSKTIRRKHSDHLRLPHVILKSASTRQSFLLFIQQKVMENPVAGTFSGYGLATSGATVPSF